MKLKLLLLSAVWACASLQAHAIGRMADVTVVDRRSGAILPLHYYKGEYWVAGKPGAGYAIAVRNHLDERLLAVTSVDGVNILSGETASWQQTGYVFSMSDEYQMTGWRKSDSEVARFEFASLGNSYAARTGRPGQVGVIGVALFRERLPEPAASSFSAEPKNRDENARGKSTAGATDAAAPSSKLGTAHGSRESSVVSSTEFERAQNRPDEIIRIRYDSRENLMASGVIARPVLRLPAPVRPNPFPDSSTDSYVPDPPPRRF